VSRILPQWQTSRVWILGGTTGRKWTVHEKQCEHNVKDALIL